MEASGKTMWRCKVRGVIASLGLLLGGAFGCVSGEVVSSGALLPQPETTFDDGQLRVTAEHDCDGSRCKRVEVTFENIGEERIEILGQGARISRAGQSYPLVAEKEVAAKTRVLAPGQKVSAVFLPVDMRTSAPLTYVQTKQVWCSLKVHSECKNPAVGESLCAGFARYYYDTYLATSGWVSLSFPYKLRAKTETLGTVKPAVATDPPAVKPEPDTNAPSWSSSGRPGVVFHKVACDAQCQCAEVTKRRNFFLDDRFEPLPE